MFMIITEGVLEQAAEEKENNFNHDNQHVSDDQFQKIETKVIPAYENHYSN